MNVRKSFSRMPKPERDAFLAALLRMKHEVVDDTAPIGQQITYFDQFVLIHNAANEGITLNGGPQVDPAHQGAAFGPWHREFLIHFELTLQMFDPNVTLPYWDWTDHVGTQNIVLNEFGLGPDGDPSDGNAIKLGYLAFEKPDTGDNSTPLPTWYPAGMNGWHPDPRLVVDSTYDRLKRNIGSFTSLATSFHVRDTLSTPTGLTTDAEAYNQFRNALEGGFRMHNSTHNWFGIPSHMRNPGQSPNDPMFFLHHANCDRLWAMWQMDGHSGSSFYPTAGQKQGHTLNEPLWPWIGALGGYTAPYVTSDLVIPDYSGDVVRTAVDVFDHRNITLNGVEVGYAYDSQVIVGIALDRSGSMNGPTPDPIVGMPATTTKWVAAKRGVGSFLQDAEAAHEAAEAYVVAGVNTFTTAADSPSINPVASVSQKFGIVKTGSPYAKAAFDADISGVAAGGGTPLASALSETEDNLVRAPFNDKPTDEQRYLCILTDGKETADPLLSTLGTPEFENTIIFAMGFGEGGGWDGVDYATIEDLTNKGKAAPDDVQTTFHGENVDTINKFFTNTIAHTLGYEAIIDPRFELFAGEYVMTPFEATRRDQSFMIVAQGYDYQDKNWSYHFLGPDGTIYRKSTTDDIGITIVRREARLSAFINRNGAPEEKWVGTWYVVATYKSASERLMLMPSTWEFLVPAGSPPLLGPMFTRASGQAKMVPVRALPRTDTMRHPFPQPSSSGKTDDACALSITIFAKPLLSTKVTSRTMRNVAGNVIDIQVRLEDLGLSNIESVEVIGRLVAPKFSIGNAVADFKTIPASERQKFLIDHKDGPGDALDLVKFLGAYESKSPRFIGMRDEEVEFIPDGTGGFHARVQETKMPGVYRMGISVLGTVRCSDGTLERVFRVLNTESALGIRPEREKTRPNLFWLTPKNFAIRFLPQDGLGNVAVPDRSAIKLFYRRQPVAYKYQEAGDGAIELLAEIAGRGAKVDSSGTKLFGNPTLKGELGTISIAKDTPLTFSLQIGSTKMNVIVPNRVSDGRGRGHAAGSEAARKIPLNRRRTADS